MERSVKVDFFNFTTRRSIAEVCSLFSTLKNPLVAAERGLHGYHLSFTSSDGVTILFSVGRPDVHVQVTGRGCESLGLLDMDVVDLLSAGDHVTRMDIAIDCLGSGVTCSEIWGLLQRGDFISVSSDIRQCEGLLSRGSRFERINRGSAAPRDKTRTNSGHTIYVGSSSSDRMVRIYDKGAESQTGTDWLRFEIQLRRESANQFYLLMEAGGDLSKLGLGLLNKQIRLVCEGQESRIEQRNYSFLKIHPFWEKLTDMTTALKLCIPATVKTVQGTLRYVKNAAASIKALKGVMDDFEEFFAGILDNAKLNDKHRTMQDDFMGYEALHYPSCCLTH